MVSLSTMGNIAFSASRKSRSGLHATQARFGETFLESGEARQSCGFDEARRLGRAASLIEHMNEAVPHGAGLFAIAAEKMPRPIRADIQARGQLAEHDLPAKAGPFENIQCAQRFRRFRQMGAPSNLGRFSRLSPE